MLTLLQLLTSEIAQACKPARLSALQLLDCLLSSAGALHIGDTCRKPPKPPATKPSTAKSKETGKDGTAAAAAAAAEASPGQADIATTSAAAAVTAATAAVADALQEAGEAAATGAAPMEDAAPTPIVSTGQLLPCFVKAI